MATPRKRRAPRVTQGQAFNPPTRYPGRTSGQNRWGNTGLVNTPWGKTPGLATGGTTGGPAARTRPDAPDEGEWELIGYTEDGQEIWQNTVTKALEYREGSEEEEEDEEKSKANKENALAYLKGILTQYGLEDPELLDFARHAVEQGWDPTRFTNELRNHPAYLKNPLFAANMERAKKGGGFMAEGQIIAYKNEVKRLAKQFGFDSPSDNYIAEGLKNGKSLAEFEHILGIQRRIQEYGEPVRRYAEEWLGVQLGDQDLFEVFSDEHDTADFDRAFKLAQYQGRPIMLGFAGRSAEEARAYEMLGLNPDEVFSRFESAKGVKFRTDRLSLIEGDLIGSMDRDALQQVLKGHEDLVVRASVLQDSRAQSELQNLLMREAARWRTSSSSQTSQSGQAIGLLSSSERQTFG